MIRDLFDNRYFWLGLVGALLATYVVAYLGNWLSLS